MRYFENFRGYISGFYYESLVGRKVIRPLKVVAKSTKFNVKKDQAYAEEVYQNKVGKKLSLASPEDFNEKLQWLKLFDRHPLHTVCADKFSVRKIVEQQIGAEYLIPLLYKTFDWKDITKENVVNGSVIKCNHDSGNVHIVEDVNTFDFVTAQNKIRRSLRKNYYHSYREWQYKNIEPMIIVEKLILDFNGDIPKDYKFFCFDGVCEYIQVDSDRFSQHTRDIFDITWTKQDIKYKFPNSTTQISPPTNLQLMISLAEKLSSAFPFCRVDFYDTGDKVYFGEITFHPEAGFGKIEPEHWQKIWGDKIKLKKTTSF